MGPRGVPGQGPGPASLLRGPWSGSPQGGCGAGEGHLGDSAVLKGTPCAAHLSEHLNFPSLYDRPIQLLPGSVSV